MEIKNVRRIVQNLHFWGSVRLDQIWPELQLSASHHGLKHLQIQSYYLQNADKIMLLFCKKKKNTLWNEAPVLLFIWIHTTNFNTTMITMFMTD